MTTLRGRLVGLLYCSSGLGISKMHLALLIIPGFVLFRCGISWYTVPISQCELRL